MIQLCRFESINLPSLHETEISKLSGCSDQKIIMRTGSVELHDSSLRRPAVNWENTCNIHNNLNYKSYDNRSFQYQADVCQWKFRLMTLEFRHHAVLRALIRNDYSTQL